MIVKIQNRRGEYLDYDPSKLLPGEFAVVQMGDPNTPTGKGVYLAISAGDVVRLATTEEIAAYTQQFDDIYQSTVHDAQQILDTAKSLVSNYSGGLIVVSSTSAMTDTSSLYLYTGSGQYHNYVYAYDSSQSQFVPFFDYGIITEVDEVVAKSAYTTVLSATTYDTKEAALAALDSYATNLGGSVRIVGYISTTNSVLLGLPKNTSHFMDFYVNSASYRLLVARPLSGTNIYQLAKQGGNWGSTWQTLANQTDVNSLTALTQGRQYGSIAAMYPELISLLAVNQGVWCTATGDLIASLTNSEITKVCRVRVIKADSAVLDYMLFAPGSNAIYIGRINSTSSITNRNRFALTSDVATNTANIATNTANIATNTSSIGTINSTLTTLTGTQASSTPAGTDLNTLTDTGIYQVGDLSQMTNGPIATGYGSLEVIKSRTYILQRFVHMSATAYSTEYLRVSVDNGSTWRSWHLAALPAVNTFTASTTSFASVNSTYVSDYRLAAAKIGRMCFISGYFSFTSTAAPAETLFATLPDAYKPWVEWTVLGTITSGTSANEARNMLLKTNGQLIIHNTGTPASTYIRFEAAYVSAS